MRSVMSEGAVPTASLLSGERFRSWAGAWRMGEDPRSRQQELEALRVGIELGMTLIDTAEMYGNGASEEPVGGAIAGRSDQVFPVSRCCPSTPPVEARWRPASAACNASAPPRAGAAGGKP